MCLYQTTGEFTGRDTCVTDVRYDSGNRLVAIGGKDCNRWHEKTEVVHSDIERVNRVFRIVEVQDESLVKLGLLLQSDADACSERYFVSKDLSANKRERAVERHRLGLNAS